MKSRFNISNIKIPKFNNKKIHKTKIANFTKQKVIKIVNQKIVSSLISKSSNNTSSANPKVINIVNSKILNSNKNKTIIPTNKEAVIIVAGGSGKRMGADIPKQFLLIKKKPILFHTIEAFYNYSKDIKIVVVLPENQISYWQNIMINYDTKVKYKIVAGGSERFYSVKNGLKAVSDSEYIAVHDGVRPFVSQDLIRKGFEIVRNFGNAVAAIKVKNSYRIISNNTNKQIDRDKLRIIQTPQIFKYDLLSEAYEQEFCKYFTDDASVVEKLGYKINLFEGNEKNIKITTKYDIEPYY